MTGPFADTYTAYWDAGWRGILPLPPGQKWPPPSGTTGYDGVDPSFADDAAWADDRGGGNIALRLPADIIGLDVDAYDDRPGHDTLTGLVDAHGPLPPTVMSTSRGDGMSGIRLYRVPAGTRLVTALPGLELIQRHHRYAVVWPSIHPTGGTYLWVDEATGRTLEAPPHVGDLPALPAAWVTGLADTTTSSNGGKPAAVDDDIIAGTLAALPAGDPCRHVLAAAGKALTGGARHDSYNAAVLAVVGRGRDGCPGALTVLQRLRAAFTAEISDRATPGEAAGEWMRSLRGAVTLTANRPLGPGACPDDTTAHLTDTGVLPTPRPEATPAEAAYTAAVERRFTDLKVAADARALLAAHEAGLAPPLTAVTLPDFLAQPDDPIRYRVDRLWPADGRVLLVAAAKTGKTTMVARNLLPALVDGGQFLGRFDTQPTSRKVAYFNLEVSESQMRAWLRTASITDPGRLLVVNLRGKASALQLTSPAGRQRLSAFLSAHDVDTVILDPLAPVLAAHGLSEDSNSDTAAFFAWWGEALADAGVSTDLICHHAGHGGQRSRGASRLLDEPDAIWTITRQEAGGDDDGELLPVDPTRFLTCYGRDVDHPAAALSFDPGTGRLTLTGDTPGRIRRRSQDESYEARVRSVFAERPGEQLSQREIVRSGGSIDQMKSAVDRLIRRGEIRAEDLGSGRGFKLWMPSQIGGWHEVARGDTGTGVPGGGTAPSREERFRATPNPGTGTPQAVPPPATQTTIEDPPDSTQTPSDWVDPYHNAVTGVATADDAPILTRAWQATLDILTTTHSPSPRSDLADQVAETVGCSPKTVENLLRAAEKAGIVTGRIPRRGEPGHPRLHVQPLSERP